MLKPADQILQPDPLVAGTFGRDGAATLSIFEHHDAVAEITILDCVPDAVHVAFDRARNAFVYAWFAYDLGAVAEAQSLFTVELALRLRLGGRVHERDSISNLIEKAIRDRLIRENDPGDPPLALQFRMMRNEWAHGSDHVHTPALTLGLLQLCADLINEAYQGFASDVDYP